MPWEVGVSNPTPRPGEDITISGRWLIHTWLCTTYPAYCPPGTPECLELVIDELVLSRSSMDREGRFSFPVRAPYVPGPYTYFVECKVCPSEEKRSPPIGIEVVEGPSPEGNLLWLALVGILGVGLVLYAVR